MNITKIYSYNKGKIIIFIKTFMYLCKIDIYKTVLHIYEHSCNKIQADG